MTDAPVYQGPNADLVNAVLGAGFSPAQEPESSLADVEFITDVERAFGHGLEQDWETRFQLGPRGRKLLRKTDEEEAFSEGILWQDLRAGMVAAEVWTQSYSEWSSEYRRELAVLDFLNDLWKPIGDSLCEAAPGLDRDMAESIGEDIGAIQLYTAQARAFRGREATFYETLFSFCLKGFWPCGYRGSWPDDGHYLLWYPARSSD